MQVETSREALRKAATEAQTVAPGPWTCDIYQSGSVTVLFAKTPHENRHGPHWFGASVMHYNIAEAGVTEEQADREKAIVGLYLREVSPEVVLTLISERDAATARAEAAENALFTLRNRAGCGPDQSGPDVWQQRDAAIAERDALHTVGRRLLGMAASREYSASIGRHLAEHLTWPDDAPDAVHPTLEEARAALTSAKESSA